MQLIFLHWNYFHLAVACLFLSKTITISLQQRVCLQSPEAKGKPFTTKHHVDCVCAAMTRPSVYLTCLYRIEHAAQWLMIQKKPCIQRASERVSNYAAISRRLKFSGAKKLFCILCARGKTGMETILCALDTFLIADLEIIEWIYRKTVATKNSNFGQY